MNQLLALRVLDDIMKWDEPTRISEFNWLELMSKFKFDAYQDFGAGMRFMERLADWLQQFPQTDRNVAYQFVKEKLIYLTSGEINHLVELFYYQQVQPFVQRQVAQSLEIKPYLVWSRSESIVRYERFLRECLFFGLSDGSRADVFRRVNTPLIKNDQVLLTTEISEEKWEDLRNNLRSDLQDSDARFRFVFLLDDFVGTGSTLIRIEKGKLKGRLLRFWESLPASPSEFLTDDFHVQVHHYVATADATEGVVKRERQIRSERGNKWFPSVNFSFGTILPASIKLSAANAGDFGRLIEKHYNEKIETKSTAVGGTENIKYGYGDCGLPLILEHNTPNNSLPILWADVDDVPEMRPLFRRRQRYSA